MENDVRFAVDSFNRFRRPHIEARIVGVENKTAIIEFVGGREQIDYYIDYFRDKLESSLGNQVKLESLEKDGTCIARFAIHKTTKEHEDPLQTALKIMDKYYEGATVKFGFED